MTSLAKRRFVSELQELDWDFAGEATRDGLAASHWYPARFVPQVPGILLGYFSEPGDRILDPFCGSGTTLVEAVRLGRRAIGVDTNPVAVIISRAKTVQASATEWLEYERELRKRVAAHALDSDSDWIKQVVPNFEENSLWYGPETLRELASVWVSISQLHSPYRVVAEATFSSILRRVCSQDKHWGWICDNVRPAAVVNKPATSLFFQRLSANADLLVALTAQAMRASGADSPDVRVACGDSKQALKELPEGSIDAVVTSPPYYGMTDYVRSQRLSFLWFEWDFDAARAMESGARYKRHRKTSWEEYMSDLTEAFIELSRVTRPGGKLGIVLGESPSRRGYIQQLKQVLVDECGLTIEVVLERQVAIQRALSSKPQREEIVVAVRKGR